MTEDRLRDGDPVTLTEFLLARDRIGISKGPATAGVASTETAPGCGRPEGVDVEERTAPECGCITTGKIVRGMCAMHYDRWVHSTPKAERSVAPRFARQFDDFVDKSGECWIWTGPTNRSGYGWWSGNGERGLAHRIALARERKPSDPGLFACHRCDTPACVNPRHLYWGTIRDNTDDMLARGGVHNKGQFADVCLRGHAMTGDNIRVVGRDKRRQCRACDNMRSRERQRRYRQERADGSR